MQQHRSSQTVISHNLNSKFIAIWTDLLFKLRLIRFIFTIGTANLMELTYLLTRNITIRLTILGGITEIVTLRICWERLEHWMVQMVPFRLHQG